MKCKIFLIVLAVSLTVIFPVVSNAQIGRRFPSEKKIVKDPVTGTMLRFLTSAADHQHPTVSPDGTKIEIQSAMLSADDSSMKIRIIPIPEDWLKRKY